jgi:hypothetical protein
MSPMAMQRLAADGGRSPLVFHDLSRLLGHENIDPVVQKSRYQPSHERAFATCCSSRPPTVLSGHVHAYA